MFLTPSKTVERVPSQQGTRKELRKEFWVWPKGEIYLFSGRGGGGELSEKKQKPIPAIQNNKSPQTPSIYTFLPRTNNFFPNLTASKKLA